LLWVIYLFHINLVQDHIISPVASFRTIVHILVECPALKPYCSSDVHRLSLYLPQAWCYSPCARTVNKYPKNVIHRASAHCEFKAQKCYATCACTMDKHGENVIHRACAHCIVRCYSTCMRTVNNGRKMLFTVRLAKSKSLVATYLGPTTNEITHGAE